jgi:ceramide glucosyltransferase
MAYLHFLLIVPVILSVLLRIRDHMLARSYYKEYPLRNPGPDWTPNVSVIVPVRGIDDYAAENFRSLLNRSYAGDYEVIFAVEDGDDPVAPVIHQIIRECGSGRSRLVVHQPRC